MALYVNGSAWKRKDDWFWQIIYKSGVLLILLCLDTLTKCLYSIRINPVGWILFSLKD
ncbi:protein of unknown function [Alcaligenes faecalis subsp. faecalis]|nr:protein of unknown function [Alcaligenes faecalis subsp. faecalis]